MTVHRPLFNSAVSPRYFIKMFKFSFLNEILTLLSYNNGIDRIRRILGVKIIRDSRRYDYLARVSALLVAMILIAGISGCSDHPTPPCGSQNLEIRTWYDLAAVRDNLCGNHTLMNDLNSSTSGYEELAGPMANGGRGWLPIGLSDIEYLFSFKGIFDGQGYEIHDLFIHQSPPSAFFELGLFGLSYGTIRDVGVVNATMIGVDGRAVGALVGDNSGTVSNSYSTGNVSGHYEYGRVGGLIGDNSGTVSDSYSTASVTGITYVGGLVGGNYHGVVSNSYSTGTVAGNWSVGGLIGYNGDGTVSNSFWDIETSGQATSDGGTGKNTTEMQDIATFSIAGWNIIAVALNQTNPAYTWNIVNNVTYPLLSWQL
jgi:hypothetical protein